MNKKFSVVMSVYKNDKPEFLCAAIDSLLNQTVNPDEIIIICDGPITSRLDNVLKSYSGYENVLIIKLPENVGLASSRKEAIKKASFDIIVMDSDDICELDRFERQINVIEANSKIVVSGWIEEFNDTPKDKGVIRKTPTNYQKIISYGKWKNPINHVTLMFTRKAYDCAGGYSSFRHLEDWDLISRMLVKGIKVIGIPHVLVNVRAGDEMIERRRNIEQFKGELRLFLKMYKVGFLNIFQLLGNMSIRIVLRVLPRFITKLTYKYLLRK